LCLARGNTTVAHTAQINTSNILKAAENSKVEKRGALQGEKHARFVQDAYGETGLMNDLKLSDETDAPAIHWIVDHYRQERVTSYRLT